MTNCHTGNRLYQVNPVAHWWRLQSRKKSRCGVERLNNFSASTENKQLVPHHNQMVLAPAMYHAREILPSVSHVVVTLDCPQHFKVVRVVFVIKIVEVIEVAIFFVTQVIFIIAFIFVFYVITLIIV